MDNTTKNVPMFYCPELYEKRIAAQRSRNCVQVFVKEGYSLSSSVRGMAPQSVLSISFVYLYSL